MKVTSGISLPLCRTSGMIAVASLLALTAGPASAGLLTPTEAGSLTSFTYSGYSVVNEVNVTISGSPGRTGTLALVRLISSARRPMPAKSWLLGALTSSTTYKAAIYTILCLHLSQIMAASAHNDQLYAAR